MNEWWQVGVVAAADDDDVEQRKLTRNGVRTADDVVTNVKKQSINQTDRPTYLSIFLFLISTNYHKQRPSIYPSIHPHHNSFIDSFIIQQLAICCPCTRLLLLFLRLQLAVDQLGPPRRVAAQQCVQLLLSGLHCSLSELQHLFWGKLLAWQRTDRDIGQIEGIDRGNVQIEGIDRGDREKGQ